MFDMWTAPYASAILSSCPFPPHPMPHGISHKQISPISRHHMPFFPSIKGHSVTRPYKQGRAWIMQALTNGYMDLTLSIFTRPQLMSTNTDLLLSQINQGGFQWRGRGNKYLSVEVYVHCTLYSMLINAVIAQLAQKARNMWHPG